MKSYHILFLLAVNCMLHAVTPGSVFSDNMVIQRDAPVRVWGTAAPGETVTAMIRPERIRFSDAPGNNVIEARLTARSFTGESCEWEFEAAGEKFTVIESAPPERTPGRNYLLHFPAGHLIRMR